MKTLVVGLDCADWSFFSRWQPDYLCSVPLRSQVGLTGSEWMSIWTGIPVTALGLYNVHGQRLSREENPIRRYRELTGQSFLWWELAEEAGHPAAICAAPGCYPPRIRHGWLLCGVGTRDDDFVLVRGDLDKYGEPPGLTEDLPPDSFVFSDIAHYLGREALAHNEVRRLRRFVTGIGYEGLLNLARRDGDLLIDYYVSNIADIDVGFIYFRFLDIALHCHGLTWAGAEDGSGKAEPAYELVMHFIDRLYNEVKPEHFFVVSDHGSAGRIHSDTGVFAWNPTDVTPEKHGEVELGKAEPDDRTDWMQRVPIVQTPWRLETQDVAALFLAPLGLRPNSLGKQPYTEEDEAKVTARLRALGYID